MNSSEGFDLGIRELGENGIVVSTIDEDSRCIGP